MSVGTNTVDAATLLGRCALFRNMTPEVLQRIAVHFEPTRYNAGEILFREGDPGDSLIVMGDGDVEVTKVVGQTPHVLNRLGPGEHVGEMALISKQRRSATVRAMKHFEGLVLKQAAFDTLLAEEPIFAREMLNAISERLRRTDETALDQMVTAHQALTFALAKLADSRDPETGGHLYRVREYCALLAELLKTHPKYGPQVTDEFIQNIFLVAPLHDIGKVAIPDGILLKPGRLTDAEFKVMSTHTTLGAAAVDTVLEFCDFELFRMAKRVILCHHERFDGKGYPRKLQGEEIPLEARIMTMADIYDALLSARVYKPAFSYEQAKTEIKNESGLRFDPEIVTVMIDNIHRFEDVHRRFKDENPDEAH